MNSQNCFEYPHPISKVFWIEVDELKDNDYNPNVVYTLEMKLLEHSIFKNGWIQPILISNDKIIIDGFHRATIAKTSKKIRDKFGTKVPVVALNISEPERMLLSIRINRAKGSHIAQRMADIIKALVNKHGYTVEQICQEMGATKEEITLLLMDDVFKALDIKNHQYSEAWEPEK